MNRWLRLPKAPMTKLGEKIFDLMLTLSPIAQWPPEMLDEKRKTYGYIGTRRLQLEDRR